MIRSLSRRVCWYALVGVFVFVFFGHSIVSGQDTLRIATYNILNYPGSDATTRNPYFRAVLHSMKPDVLVVQEMQSQIGVDGFRSNVLNSYQSGLYTSVPFNNGPDTDNSFFYKSSRVTYHGATYIPTALRDIAEYRFSPIGSSDTIRFYSLHLKASDGGTNETLRLAEATILRNHLNGLPTGSKFIIGGDYNIYRSSEPAFQKLIGSEVNNNGRSKDPLNAIGTWNSLTFRFIHTQSPRVRVFGGGAPGGMDDRFDMLLTSYSIDPQLILSSYTAYGNDGNHYNDSINRLPNTAVPDSVANGLHYASDHIPVFARFVFTTSSSAPTITVTGGPFNFGTVVSGSFSAQQSFVVSGANLTDNITIAPPTGFQISTTSGSGFTTSPIVLTQSGGLVGNTTIYSRFAPTNYGSVNGTISSTSTGATTKTVGVSGIGIATEPTLQSTVSFGTISSTSLVVNLSDGNGAKRILLARSGSAVADTPVDATTYTANSDFSVAPTLGSSRIVFAGSGSTVTLTGLVAGTAYHFASYEYNDGNTAGAENYLTTTPGVNNATTTTSASIFYSRGSMDPTVLANWNSERNGSGSAPGNFTSGNLFLIQNGHTMTTTAAWAVSGTGHRIQIESGGTLQADHLVATTTFQIDNGGTYIHNAVNGANGASTDIPGPTTRSFGSSSTVEIRKWGDGTGTNLVALPSGVLWGNLTINIATTMAASWQQNGSVANIAGNLSILSTGLTTREFRLSANTPYTLILGGDLNISGGILNLTNGSNTAASPMDLTIGGSFNQTGGTFTQNATNHISIVRFAGLGKSFTRASGTLTATKINWIISSSASLDLYNDLPVSSGRSLTVNGTLNCGTNAVTGEGSFTLASGATLSIGSLAGITSSGPTGNIQTSGRSFDIGANYAYNGTSAQVTGNGLPITVNNLTISNSAGVSLTGAATVNNTLALANGALSIGSNTLTLNGPIDRIGGTLIGGSSSAITFGGAGAGTTLPSIVVQNLTINRVSGISLGGATTVNGSLTLAGGALFIGSNTLSLNGGISQSGGTLEGASQSAIVFGGSAASTILPAVSLGNLTINRTTGILLGGDVTVHGALTLDNGSLSIGANMITLNGDISQGSGTLTGGSSSNIMVGGTGGATILPAVVLQNLIIDRPSGIFLDGPVTVEGALTIIRGIVSTDANVITLGPGATLSEPVTSPIVGIVTTTRTLGQSVNNTFGGIGIEINAAGTSPGLTTVSRRTGVASTGNGYQSILRYFDVSPTTNVGLNATVVFRYHDSELNGHSSANLRLFRSSDSGLAWELVGGTVDTEARKITATSLASMSRFTASDSLRPLSGLLAQPIHVFGGWNLISVPRTVPDYLRTSLFPTSNSWAYAYVGGSPPQGYLQRDTLANRVGYWLKFPNSQDVTITGEARRQDTVFVTAGWNIVGTITDSVATSSVFQSPSNNILSPFFRFEGGYIGSTVLAPGRGYWVKVAQSGTLILQAVVDRPAQ